MTASPLLVVSDLRVEFPIGGGLLRASERVLTAVDGVSLTLDRSEVVALVGESGSGKTTIARCLVGLQVPTSGAITLLGERLGTKAFKRPEVRRRVQMVFQDPYASLNPRRSIRDVMIDALRLRGVPRSRLDAEAIQCLEMVGLEPTQATLRRFPHEFSGGQRQRISIARALATGPDLIVADEAVSSLDTSVRAQILQLLQSLRTERQVAILFITHDLTVVRAFADRVLVTYLGRVIEEGTTSDVFAHSRHPYTASLLAATPAPRRGQKPLHIRALGEIADPAHPPSGCTFHPRCPMRQERCVVDFPDAADFGAGHFAWCHYAADVPAPKLIPASRPRAAIGDAARQREGFLL
jgi:oligopeptide/dipeptide ABC transporter ATP-binding protein